MHAFPSQFFDISYHSAIYNVYSCYYHDYYYKLLLLLVFLVIAVISITVLILLIIGREQGACKRKSLTEMAASTASRARQSVPHLMADA